MKSETQVNRVTRFCEKLIAREAKMVDVYGKTGAYVYVQQADVARRILRLMVRP